MRILVLVLLLVPQLVLARVYMCLDPATGKTSFSDTGCKSLATHEEVKVQVTNVTSGSRTAADPPPKTWTSDLDTRKTGLDYSAQQRGIKGNKATASALSLTDNDDS